MIEYDVHLHSDFSTDSEEKQENIVERAKAIGLSGICFTDHMDLYYPEKCIRDAGGDFTFDIDRYFEKLFEIKEKYKKDSEVLIGMEIGLRNEPGIKEKCREEYEEMLKKYPFDFIIGSTHCLEDIDPYYKEYWDGRTAEEGLDGYFDAIAQNVADYDCFDTLGHIDYLVRYVTKESALRSIEKRGLGDILRRKDADMSDKRLYAKYLYEPHMYYEVIEDILKNIIDRGKALEVNTSGIKYGLGFAHPKQEILKLYRELGGELITIGSDAHCCGHLAYDFEAACRMLKELGFRYYFVYRGRKPEGYVL